MRVHTYVISTDAGSAPNYGSPCVTLAVCKPRIRRKASVGELVMAFAGKNVNAHEPHTVVWAGLVSEKLTFPQYWNDKRFRNKRPDRSQRPDNFYKPVGSELVWVENNVHDPDAIGHDTGGQFVLTFPRAWRFGAHGPLLPTEFGLRMTGGRRGERVVDLTDNTWRRLRAWLDSNVDETMPDVPSDRHCEWHPPLGGSTASIPSKRRC